MNDVVVVGAFDNLKSQPMRLLQEAAKRGPVHVLLWSDNAILELEGQAPKFSQAERHYLLDTVRYVDRVTIRDCLPQRAVFPTDFATPNTIWVVDQANDEPDKLSWCRANAVQYCVIPQDLLKTFPDDTPEALDAPSSRKKVIVTGCYDWFHSGHVRFFEEVSELGDLYVVVGHDANVELLKGEGHPMFPGIERRCMAGSIRYVKHALISTGDGWLDAEPEIERIKPDIYTVNEDGDRPEKREYCETHGIEYRVLKRTPKEGLPKRQSTDLRLLNERRLSTLLTQAQQVLRLYRPCVGGATTDGQVCTR